jgi:subtilisin family serine protease
VPPGAEQRYAAQLAAMPGVVYAQPDHAVTAQVEPNDPRYAEQWNMTHIGMPKAWTIVTDTSSLTIAILDTGIKTNHPDLQHQLWTNPGEIEANGVDDDGNGFVDDLHGWHFYQVYANGMAMPFQNSDIGDHNGHGSHVAGIIAASGNNGIGVAGVAWKARLMVLRILDDDAAGWESDVIRGLQYAVANGARVINLSLGLAERTPALEAAVAAAAAQDVLLVAAAGNGGGNVLYPAAFPSVLSVSASDRQDRRADFGAYGPSLDLLAPGVDIISTWNGVPYFSRSGTSMAAPHATGVAALLWARMPAATARDVGTCLMLTATDVEIPGRDDETGWGVLNAERAVQGCAKPVYLPLLNHQ